MKDSFPRPERSIAGTTDVAEFRDSLWEGGIKRGVCQEKSSVKFVDSCYI